VKSYPKNGRKDLRRMEKNKKGRFPATSISRIPGTEGGREESERQSNNRQNWEELTCGEEGRSIRRRGARRGTEQSSGERALSDAVGGWCGRKGMDGLIDLSPAPLVNCSLLFLPR